MKKKEICVGDNFRDNQENLRKTRKHFVKRKIVGQEDGDI